MGSYFFGSLSLLIVVVANLTEMFFKIIVMFTVRNVSHGPSMVIVMAAVACIIALMMPTQGETDSRLPDYLHLHNSQKLIAAYILGE